MCKCMCVSIFCSMRVRGLVMLVSVSRENFFNYKFKVSRDGAALNYQSTALTETLPL